MLIRRAYAASVLGALTLALALGVQPAWGATRLSQTGTVGASAISEPGATCKYVFLPASYWIQLRRIVVAPPLMKAVSGKSAQKVGWTFTVQRAIVGVNSQMPWENRYTSAEMTATTDAAHNAAFSSASVRVIVPDKPGSAGAASIYRVMVTLFWHRSDGTVSGSVRWRVDTYRYQSDTGQAGTRAKNCESYLY